jgi:hypothetical protein
MSAHARASIPICRNSGDLHAASDEAGEGQQDVQHQQRNNTVAKTTDHHGRRDHQQRPPASAPWRRSSQLPRKLQRLCSVIPSTAAHRVRTWIQTVHRHTVCGEGSTQPQLSARRGTGHRTVCLHPRRRRHRSERERENAASAPPEGP